MYYYIDFISRNLLECSDKRTDNKAVDLTEKCRWFHGNCYDTIYAVHILLLLRTFLDVRSVPDLKISNPEMVLIYIQLNTVGLTPTPVLQTAPQTGSNFRSTLNVNNEF